MALDSKGVNKETTTGVHLPKDMAAKGELLFPAINVYDCVMKSDFNNVYGCFHSLPDDIMRAMDKMYCDKRALGCGYGEMDKGAARAKLTYKEESVMRGIGWAGGAGSAPASYNNDPT